MSSSIPEIPLTPALDTAIEPPELQIIPPSSTGIIEDGPVLNRNSSFQSTESPRIFALKVRRHSKTSVKTSLYSGQGYDTLASFLEEPYTRPRTATLYGPKTGNNDDFAWLYNLHPQNSPSAVKLSLPLRHSDSIEHGSLIFLHGYPSAEWICELGSKYSIDPEFFYRHLNFLSDSQHFSHATPFILPSYRSNIFQLTLTSVGTKNGPNLATVRKQRLDAASEMTNYFHNLKIVDGQFKLGDSIVRSYAVHDRTQFSIEQYATIYVSRLSKDSDKWIAVVWLDAGDDPGSSPPGPWFTTPKDTFHTYLHPITQYKPNVALVNHEVLEDSPQESVSKGPAQSIALLPKYYGKSLNTSVMHQDPFYALKELFDYASCSESQFLNAIAKKLDEGVQSVRNATTGADASIHFQEDLIYFRRIIEQHIHWISETLSFIVNRNDLPWPRSEMRKAVAGGMRVQKDFEYLRDCSLALHRRCDREMTILMSNTSIDEARRGIEQSRRTHKFTVLACLYVPLSFTSSAFGMNFVRFSDSRMGYWVYFLVTLLIFIISVLILIWDTKKILWRLKRSL